MAEERRYPADLTVDYPQRSSRVLALLGALFLLKGILLIPHIIVLYFLGIAQFIVIYMGYWATLVLGRYPTSLFDFGVGVQRWSFRVSAWLYGWTDRYPPFSLR